MWILASCLTALSAQARFCTKVETVGDVSAGTAASVNAADRQVLEIRSVTTDSRLVQRADVTLTFTIPEAVALVDVAAMQADLHAQASTTKVTAIVELWDHRPRMIKRGKQTVAGPPIGWRPVDSIRFGLSMEESNFGIRPAAAYIHPKTREMRMRIRTKRETTAPYFIKIDAVNLIGIRPEGLADYGDLFAVGDDSPDKSNFEAKLKKLKDDWDLSFNKGGRIIPIKDWESTEERKEKLKQTWRDNFNKHGNVRTIEQQLR